MAIRSPGRIDFTCRTYLSCVRCVPLLHLPDAVASEAIGLIALGVVARTDEPTWPRPVAPSIGCHSSPSPTASSGRPISMRGAPSQRGCRPEHAPNPATTSHTARRPALRAECGTMHDHPLRAVLQGALSNRRVPTPAHPLLPVWRPCPSDTRPRQAIPANQGTAVDVVPPRPIGPWARAAC